MAAGVILQFGPEVGEPEYRAVNAALGLDMQTGEGDWPDGLLSHDAGISDEGWVVTEVWESKDAQAAFMESRLGPAFHATNMPAPTKILWYEVSASQHRH
jgi:hypothetical protein